MAILDGFLRAGEEFFGSMASFIAKNFYPQIDSRFLFAGGLILLLLLIPFILLYLIRPKPKKRTIPSIMFLLKDTGKSFIRSFFRTFIKDVLFLLQLLALLFMIFAVSRPYLNLPELSIDKPTVVILDVSASMQAQSRFPEALALAKDSLSSVNTLILAGNIPETVGIEKTKGQAKTILDMVKAKDTETNLYDALILAPKYLKESGRVIVISDFSTDPSYLNAQKFIESLGYKVYLKKVGSSGSNIGIVDMDIKEKKTSVNIKNYNDKQETVRVKVNENLIDTKTIEPKSSELSTFNTPFGLSKVELDVQDDFKLDNTVFMSAPEEHTVTILVISNDEKISSYDFMLALDSINANSSTRVSVEIAVPPKVPKITQDIIIYKNVDQALLLPGTIEDTVKRVKDGGAAIIMVQDTLFSINFQGLLPYTFKSRETEGFIDKESGSLSLTENVDFGTVGSYFVISPQDPDAVSVVANVGDSPVISFSRLGKGVIAYYGIFDESADFSKDPYYPIFWKRMIDFVSGKPDIRNLNYKTGRLVSLGASQEVKTPRETVKASSVFLDAAGVYTLADRTLAANLLSAAESDINAENSIGQKELEQLDEKPVPEPFDLSRWLIMAAILIIFVELLYQKFRGDL
ncbi:MAG: VWA domain-containing protein [Nanoarchaeota archaeon]